MGGAAMNYPALSLRALAGVTGITSAVAAYPVASDLFGAVPGAVVLASSAAAIYAGWHVVATSSDTDKRVVAGAVAGVFAVAMVAGIHNSAQLATATAATTAATEADKLYQDQEAARMAALSAVTAELRATQKSKYPGEYAVLQKQVDKLSTPTVRQATASQITQGLANTGGVYRWAVSSVFELVTPALLLLAGMFSRRGHGIETSGHAHGHGIETSGHGGHATGHGVDTVDTPMDTQNLKASTGAGSTPDTVLDTVDTLLDTDENDADTEGETYRYADPWKTALSALRGRRVHTTEAGNVTRQAVMDHANCSKQDAMYAMGIAVQEGHLEKSGDGRNARYTYPEQTLRAVK